MFVEQKGVFVLCFTSLKNSGVTWTTSCGQVQEEETYAVRFCDCMKNVGGQVTILPVEGPPGGLFMLDRELAQRVFAMPPRLNGG